MCVDCIVFVYICVIIMIMTQSKRELYVHIQYTIVITEKVRLYCCNTHIVRVELKLGLNARNV